jgi:L-cysteine desulfidase
MVCAGVYARMSGEDFVVMTLAGSGNKGIVTAVPITLWGREVGADPRRADEALALTCLLTSATTHHLGTLSAACGCSNAAGVGLAAGLVHLQGGGLPEISLAVSNIVGNVTGMICDGAKMGCGLKTMTSVDAAFRAASLAMSGIGIPATDGIVGADGMESLAHLGRVASAGMSAMDGQILEIMQEKLRRGEL